MKSTVLASASLTLAILALGGAWSSANAQDNPNMGHFYMARRQVTITDEAPAVNDKRTNPMPGAAGGPAGGAGLGRGLPKANWTPYSQFVPSLSTNLPKVNNGVPQPMAQAPDPYGLKGKAGKLKAARASAKPKTAPGGIPSAKTYTPYKGYGGPTQMSSKPGGNSGGGMPNYTTETGNSSASSYGNTQTETNVRGSVLHWARVKRKSL